MTIAFAFVGDPLEPATVDASFAETADALRVAGYPVWTYDGERRRLLTRGASMEGARVVYRGWMMNADEYASFATTIAARGAEAFHGLDAYLSTHHSPQWVPSLEPLTPETVFLDASADVEHEARKLGWSGFVLKDWVKSLKTSRGSIVRDPSDAPRVVAEMRMYRGTIEGGLVLRRLEALRPETERRYFVLDGVPWASTATEVVPRIVVDVAQRIATSRFFSVDIAERDDGALRVVEIGDGQVSDIVGWTPERFAEMWSGLR